ncbi:hypothetical protein Tco_1188285 [Tanacetum coccineum]
MKNSSINDGQLRIENNQRIKSKNKLKHKVTPKILPKIEKTVNEQLKAEVLTRSSNESKTSYVVAANLSKLELKKILIDKMESNKSIHRSDEQKNLYKALVDAYKECDKLILKHASADYGHIKWIEDLVPNRMWSQVPVSYDKHVLWGISHWGRKRQQFYGFAANRKSARDVYSKRRIIAVTKLQIVEWHNYKHLDWIIVHRDDDKLYKFKGGDFNRLCIQDIIYMLLLLVQGKRMEDLQLGVKSYQKKLNLTKPDMYRLDLKRREVYTAYSNPRGFIYQNKDKKNILMRIDELHKFSECTLNDVRTNLDDRLKGIRMKYLPHTIWRQSDKDKA